MINQEDIADILNIINDSLEGTKYVAVGYDNTGEFLQGIIDTE